MSPSRCRRTDAPGRGLLSRALRLVVGIAAAIGAGAVHAEVDRATVIRLSTSVLKVEVLRKQGGYSLGSGVAVESDVVATNCHVTRDGREIYVLRAGGRWRAEAQASDAAHDLCVLRVPGLGARPVALGRTDTLRLGQSVDALGYTGGLGLQNSSGHVVGLHRHDGSNVVRSSNWFNSGASGGGLFDEDLRLVGILTFRLRGGEAHYFAAPVEWLQRLLADRAAFREVRPLDPTELAFWQRPVHVQPHYLQAAILERNGDWHGLEALAHRWTAEAAGDPEPWYLRGVALDRLDRLADARQALERSVAIEPAFTEAWFRLGMVFAKLRLRQEARQALARLEALKSALAAQLALSIEQI